MSKSEFLYDQDYYAWLERTIHLLQEGDTKNLDIPHLLEEIKDSKKKEEDDLEANLIVIFKLLLKEYCQATKDLENSSKNIRETRRKIIRSLKNSPSLKSYLLEIMGKSYQEAVRQVADEIECCPKKLAEDYFFSVEVTLDVSEF